MSRVGGEWDGKGWLGLAASMTCSATPKHAPKIEILGEFGVIFLPIQTNFEHKKIGTQNPSGQKFPKSGPLCLDINLLLHLGS